MTQGKGIMILFLYGRLIKIVGASEMKNTELVDLPSKILHTDGTLIYINEEREVTGTLIFSLETFKSTCFFMI